MRFRGGQGFPTINGLPCTCRWTTRCFRIARLSALGHIACGSKPSLLQQHETNTSL